jgi:hypothetical protein
MSNLFNEASLVLVPSGYKAGKVYSQVPTNGDGDLTFTRASDATRVNSDGLIEKVRTNLLSYSNDFSNAYWSVKPASVTYNQPDPFGGNDATLVQFDTSGISAVGGGAYIIVTSGVTYTISAWVKGVDLTGFRMLVSNNMVVSVFDQIVNGEWVRVSLTGTATASGDFSAQIARAGNANGESFYIYGAQYEVSDIATDYIPTTTTAVSVGMTANVPRLDYSQGSCPSLLLEPQRTNLVTYSEQLDNAIWTKQSGVSVTANQTISPDGTQNADLVVGDGSSGIFQSGKTVSTTVANTKSVYLKGVSGGEVVRLQDPNQTIGFTVCTLTTSWQRFTLSEVQSEGSAGLWVTLIPSGGIYIWGAQLEQGAYATSYIPTTSATVTRLKDVINLNDLQNKNILSSDWTIYSEFIDYGNSTNNGTFILGLKNSTGTDWIGLFRPSAGALTLSKRENNGSVSTTVSLIQVTNGNIIKASIKCTSNNLKVYINGSLAYTSAFANPSLMTNFELARIGGALNTTLVKSALLFKTALTDAQCIELTTL